MLSESDYYCPDCDNGFDVAESQMQRRMWAAQTRREFIGRVSAGAAALIAGRAISASADEAPAEKRVPKPAEALIREFHASLSDDQKKQLVLPWDHKRNDGQLTRLGTYNSAILNKRIADHLTKPQQDLVKKTVQSILSDAEAWERITRNGSWDNSGSFEHTGCAIFGEPSDDKKYAWVFSGHHLTLRCDGNSEPNAAFGGPIYYGHTAGGYEKRNVYFYQTQQVQSVFDALDPDQRKIALAAKNPGDREAGIRFPKAGTAQPGISYERLSADQKKLVESVMRTLLDPFRQEDSDEVLEIVKANGGMEKINLAFYKDAASTDEDVRWNYWRLEGPGFIWNYRALPHVHCYVNIAKTV